MEICGLIGRKLGHSYSVPIHNGLGNGNYKLFELEPDELEAFIKEPNLRAVNVTIPYKLDVMKYCDFIDPVALEIGAVNTVVRRGERLFGYNTDHIGFCRMLEFGGIDVKDKKVLVPYCVDDAGTMIPCEIRSFSDLKEGRYGILEPLNAEEYRGKIDFSVVPGLAFSYDGYRIGYGKGYYDRFLNGRDTFSVGLSYDELLFDKIPVNEYDVKLNMIITPNKEIKL